jgi:hypothetical protein
MVLEKRAGRFQAILAAFQFRMLHVLSYRTDIVTVIVCGCEIWCLASGEERRLRVCESGGGGENLMCEGGRNRGVQKIL